MASLPRVVTVDPTGTIARIVRAAMDLLDRSMIIADVPNGTEALEELKSGRCAMLITAWDLAEDMRGLELALRAKQSSPQTAVAILADVSNPEALDEETLAESPFVYLSRPVDVGQFLRVLDAGVNGEDIREAMKAPAGQAAVTLDFGPVPHLDLNAATTIIDQLLTDLGAMAIVLSSRVGEVLMERGAVGYLDRERLTKALMPVVTTNIDVKELVGGNATALQFYDGENYDVFVLSVGMHHFMCVAFDGEGGARQFGAVSRYGRRAAEDLIALLGANAWMIQQPVLKEAPRAVRPSKKATEEVEAIQLERAEMIGSQTAPKEPELVIQQLEPVADLDFDMLFGQDMDFNFEGGDDPFDMDKMEEVANQQKKGVIGFDEAQQLGILPS